MLNVAYLCCNTDSGFLKKQVLFLLVGVNLIISAQAQTVSFSDTITGKTFSRIDTIKAIHRLFQAKRSGANLITGVGLGVAASSVMFLQIAVGIGNSISKGFGRKPATEDLTGSSIGVSLPGLFVASLAIIKRVRFSKRIEQEVVLAYENGLTLPFKIQQQLTPKYFYQKTRK